jgi:hypothetical protein
VLRAFSRPPDEQYRVRTPTYPPGYLTDGTSCLFLCPREKFIFLLYLAIARLVSTTCRHFLLLSDIRVSSPELTAQGKTG